MSVVATARTFATKSVRNTKELLSDFWVGFVPMVGIADQDRVIALVPGSTQNAVTIGMFFRICCMSM
ncbi:hypothetical protein CsSME_00049245 [Camellia sinensis var. sinensis]